MKYLFIAALAFSACTNDEDVAAIDKNSSDGLPPTSGTANFSKYVAVGNSLTAGFSDGTLFIEGQKGAWSTLVANRFALAGGGEFKVPFMSDNIGGFAGNVPGVPSNRLFFNGAGPVPVSGTPTTVLGAKLAGMFNNMGIPGAKSFHLLAPGYGNVAGLSTGQANPFFVRISSSATATVLGDAVSQSPTFFSLWIGNNDVLSYATSGGIGVNRTGNLDPATYGSNDITDPTVFASVYNSLLDGTTGLTKGGAKGVVCNIPNVTSVPYFTTIAPNAVPGLPASSAAQLNQLFSGINAALAANGLPPRFVTLVADDGNASTIESNPLLIIDETLPNISVQITAALLPTFGPAAAFLGNQYGIARHARSTAGNRDYITLPTRTLISATPPGANIQPGLPPGLTPTFAVRGISFPLQDGAVLTADETAQVNAATTAYNTTILALANSKGLAFVDTNAILARVASGNYVSNGFIVSSAYVTGGGFSLDGVHPSPRGYALIANEVMKAINAKYGSNLKAYDVGNFRIQFPGTL